MVRYALAANVCACMKIAIDAIAEHEIDKTVRFGIS